MSRMPQSGMGQGEMYAQLLLAHFVPSLPAMKSDSWSHCGGCPNVELGSGVRWGSSNAQAMDSTPEGIYSLTAACALDNGCVILDVGTSLVDSLAALEEAQQSVGMVMSDSGAIVGVLTRDSIIRAMALYSESESDSDYPGEDF